MDFHRFGIDARLAEAAEGLKVDFFFFEKLLSQILEKGQNVCAKVSLDAGREEVVLLPVLQWILSEPSHKALLLAQDPAVADRCAGAISRLGASSGIRSCKALRSAEGAVALEGDPSAEILITCLDELLELPDVNLRDYGYLVIDGADRLAEEHSQSIHKLVGLLLPPWERRSLMVCSKISAKAKNLAFELADNPVDVVIDGEVIKAQSVSKETWSVAGEEKLKFLLGLLEREKPECVCVFCNLKDTAKEVSKRLEANGIGSDYILGALALDRKLEVLDKARSGVKPCLVLTDQGAEGLSGSSFPLIVNYDIPLEPELFVKRLEMLDRARPGAKVVSLACDRYIYGLSAVESYIEAKLEARAVDQSLLAVEDKSEGRIPDPLDSRRPEGRRDVDRGRGGPHSDGRGPDHRDGSRRDSRPRRDAQYGSPREDRSPDIRRSISEATGGSLDMGGNAPLPSERQRGREDNRPRQPQRGGGERGNRGPRRQDDSSRKQGGPRNEKGDKSPRRPPSDQRRSSSRRPASDLPAKGNPYDMPIEERMKRYREKYGQDLGANKKEGQQSRRKTEVRPPREGSAKAPPPSRSLPKPTQPDKPQGFLGQLFGSFKKKAK